MKGEKIMNVKAVKDSFEQLLAGNWPSDVIDKIVELEEYFAITLLGHDNFNCLFITKSDGSRHWADKLDEAFDKKIREFTFVEFEKFLETELRKAS